MARIFIAEDDPLMSRMYERAFRLAGHTATMANDGDEAIKTLGSMSPLPEIIVLDVMMPKLSGFDVLTKIKQDTKLKGIPAVMLTNLAGKEDAEKALSLGAALYLVKSDYNPKQVVEKLAGLLASPG